MKAKPPFLVAVVEEGIIIPLSHQAIQHSLRAAKELAAEHVDDALPHNVVAVFRLVQIGYAGWSSAGDTYWQDLPERGE